MRPGQLRTQCVRIWKHHIKFFHLLQGSHRKALAEVAPVPSGKVGHMIEPEMDLLSVILSDFNDMFGNINWNDADNVRRQILEIPAMVSRDERYRNAMKNSDEQSARLESERVLQQVIFAIMADNMELFKQFQDNPSFKKWLSDLVFHLTYN